MSPYYIDNFFFRDVYEMKTPRHWFRIEMNTNVLPIYLNTHNRSFPSIAFYFHVGKTKVSEYHNEFQAIYLFIPSIFLSEIFNLVVALFRPMSAPVSWTRE